MSDVESKTWVAEGGDAAAEWQAMFDAMSDGICLLDAEGRVKRANRAFRRLTLLDSKAGEGPVPIADVLPAASDALRDLLEGRARSATIALLDRSYTFKCDRLDHGRGFVISVSGIDSERRPLAAPIVDLSQRKDEALAMLAHELRNPLNAISASLHLQSIYGAQDERNRRLRDTASRQTAHLSRLVDDLLDASRLTKGAIVLHREVVDLVKVVEGAIEGASAAIDIRRHALEVSLPNEPVWVDGDAARLEQVVVHLLDNAAKYSEPGRRIWVSLSANGSAELSVRDEGDGIADDMQGAIFEMFHQESNGLARSKGGLGIGLAVVRSLVEMHGGHVSVTSKGRGFGSTFSVHLPVHAAERKVEVDAPSMPAGVGTTRILVVEDNVEVLEMMEMALEFAGYSVETASDGLTGLELALSTHPDVALVDVGLPGIDGYQLAQRLRAEPSGKSVYMVAVTGYGRPEDRAQALRSGFDDHVVKPVRTARLLALVRNARRAQQAAAREGA